MATTSPAYGRLVTLKFGGTTLLNLKASSLKQARGSRDVTTKDSNDDFEARPTIKNRSFDFGGIMPLAGPNAPGGAALQSAYDNGTIGVCLFGDNLTGSPSWSGSGFITALDFDAPYDNNVEFKGSFQVTGVVTFA